MEHLLSLIAWSGLKRPAIDWGLPGFESTCPQDRSGRSSNYEFNGLLQQMPQRQGLRFVAATYLHRRYILHPLLEAFDMPLPLDLFLVWPQRSRVLNSDDLHPFILRLSLDYCLAFMEELHIYGEKANIG